jgi:catechol 2,3-dioxygenase-like lactoylglutathione lyase family enzyme
MLSRFHHASITVSDMKRSLSFYTNVLGLELRKMSENKIQIRKLGGEGFEDALIAIAVLRAGEENIELIHYSYPSGKPNDRRSCDVGNMHVAFLVPDIYKVYDELRKKGVEFNSPPQEIKEGPLREWTTIWTYFYDPDGVVLELVQVK